MRRVHTIFLFLLGCTLLSHEALAKQSVVLVASKNLPTHHWPAVHLRRTFLGLPLRVDGVLITPVLLRGDAELDNIFLQSVVAMSRRSYQHRLLSNTIRRGVAKPLEAESEADLAKLLTQYRGTVGYMWGHQVDKYPQLNVIKVLWQQD